MMKDSCKGEVRSKSGVWTQDFQSGRPLLQLLLPLFMTNVRSIRVWLFQVCVTSNPQKVFLFLYFQNIMWKWRQLVIMFVQNINSIVINLPISNSPLLIFIPLTFEMVKAPTKNLGKKFNLYHFFHFRPRPAVPVHHASTNGVTNLHSCLRWPGEIFRRVILRLVSF